jgi:hypothetical protein
MNLTVDTSVNVFLRNKIEMLIYRPIYQVTQIGQVHALGTMHAEHSHTLPRG